MKRPLLSLVALALLLRLIVCLRMPAADSTLEKLPDQLEYLQSGRRLLAGGGLSFVDPRFNQRVFAYRMPGYPLLVASCGGNVIAIRVAQCLLDASVVLAIHLLARRWLDARGSLLAAALVAFNPFQIYFCTLILSETLFIALMVSGFAILSGVFQRPPGSRQLGKDWSANLGVGLLSLSVLVRPSAIVLGPASALLCPSRRISRVAAAILLEVVFLSTWAYRNHRVIGEWIFTTTNSGISAYDGLNPHASGASDQRFVAEMPELQTMTETQRNHYLGGLADDFARQHTSKVIELAGRKLARFWSPIPLSAEYGSNLKLTAIALIYSLPLDGLIVIGLFFGKLPRNVKLFLMLPALYFSAVHAVGVGSLRYRIPADVPMTIIAASGAAACFGGRKLYGQAPADA